MADIYLEPHMLNLARAETLSKEAVKILESSYGKEHIDVAEALLKLAWVKMTQREAKDALRYSMTAAKIRQQHLQAGNWKIAEAKNYVAWSLTMLGRSKEGDGVFKNLYPVFEREYVNLKQQKVPENPDYKMVQSIFKLRGNAAEQSRLSAIDQEIGMTGKSSDSKKCFVATVAYGNPDCAELNFLRYYRDNKLKNTIPGRAFIHLYYRHGEQLANVINRSEFAKQVTKKLLDYLIGFIES